MIQHHPSGWSLFLSVSRTTYYLVKIQALPESQRVVAQAKQNSTLQIEQLLGFTLTASSLLVYHITEMLLPSEWPNCGALLLLLAFPAPSITLIESLELGLPATLSDSLLSMATPFPPYYCSLHHLTATNAHMAKSRCSSPVHSFGTRICVWSLGHLDGSELCLQL